MRVSDGRRTREARILTETARRNTDEAACCGREPKRYRQGHVLTPLFSVSQAAPGCSKRQTRSAQRLSTHNAAAPARSAARTAARRCRIARASGALSARYGGAKPESPSFAARSRATAARASAARPPSRRTGCRACPSPANWRASRRVPAAGTVPLPSRKKKGHRGALSRDSCAPVRLWSGCGTRRCACRSRPCHRCRRTAAPGFRNRSSAWRASIPCPRCHRARQARCR